MGLPWLAAETDWSGRVLLLVLGLGLGQFCLAYAFFARGIRLVSPLTANFLATLEPILNPVWVALIYAEQIPMRTVLGGWPHAFFRSGVQHPSCFPSARAKAPPQLTRNYPLGRSEF